MVHQPEDIVEYILIHYRWIFVCLFLLPASFVYNIWWYFRNWVVFQLNNSPSQHHNKVKGVQRQIQEWIKKRSKIATVHSQTRLADGVFSDTAVQKTLSTKSTSISSTFWKWIQRNRAEPLVTMGQLTATLNPLGWTLPVMPEIDDLTVGGVIMGTGVESSSHIYGFFQHVCLSYELVLGDGSVVKCSPTENHELFYSVPWSYGTLGILTAVELKMIPAKKYVKLTYTPVRGLKNIAKKFEEASRNTEENEFVEALGYNEDEAVIMTGVQTDTPEHEKINQIGRWYKPWFFIHVRDKLKGNTPSTEYIPLRDYYHRHTRSIFWELQDIVPFGNNPLFRLLLGWLMPPKISLLKLTQTEAIRKLYNNSHVLQDMLVPIEHFENSVKVFENAFNIYPVWFCPFTLPPNPGMVHPKENVEKLYVDIGLYGVPKVKDYKPKESTRKIEKYVRDVNGFQMLYADTYMTREEFRMMFDHSLYDKLRSEMKCERAFPEVYDKVCKEARY
ncbi:hypothetical protein NQ318_003478 [Aromia moschata]|uniref:Delta(24)-sterol reductase n=1 Tax=Aromia moschata TaxID=1265417 RepID=A0AAV8YUQ2_9CUCU|nr:hypothetical protein NQ318_003478 [Aromia moschata]